MKHSLGKLRLFASFNRSDPKDKSSTFPPAQHAELAQASKDMQSIKNCYDSLLSAAAATANSAYEFSESLQEMGACLIEKTTLHGDEDSGRLLAMLGKVQFELQQLVDTYRSHIFLTITNPSESFLNELRTVEEMKKQCDEKRDAVEYMMAQQKEKGKTKIGKADSSSLQLQRAREEYEDEENLCVFRLKSLKQGQSRSLLTQALRHHAAQMSFFKKGLKSLEAVDSHVKLIAQLLHIDYESSVIEDDVVNDGSNGFNVKESGELGFDYRSTAGMEVSTSRNSMEVDDGSFSLPRSTTKNAEAMERTHVEKPFSSREHRLVSHSAPIFPEKKTETRHLPQLSPQEPNSYVLPMPTEGKGANPRKNPAAPSGGSGSNHNLWHSSPLEQRNPRTPWELKENKSTQLPPPISDSGSSMTDSVSSDMERIKRQAFSGPLTSKENKSTQLPPPISDSGSSITDSVSSDMERIKRQAFSGPLTSKKPVLSPNASPPLGSSPRISELHELPLPPPGNLPSRAVRSVGLVGHSAPLVRNVEGSAAATNRIPLTASPLPAPPLLVPRSFSIPSSSQREITVNVGLLIEPPYVLTYLGDVSSPPLTPISLADMQPRTSVGAIGSRSGPIRGRI